MSQLNEESDYVDYLCLPKSNNFYDDLIARGCIYQAANEDKLRVLLNTGEAVIYWGTDPTGGSLHNGHLLGLNTLKRCFAAGNKVIILIGGTTALIGDPSGKRSERVLLSKSEVEKNKRSLLRSLSQVIDLDDPRVTIVDNSTWFDSMSVTEFMRDVAKRFSVNELMGLESNKSRLNGHGMSLTEFSYTSLQAFDWLHLFKEFGCNVQLGGSDQFGNITQGCGYVRSSLGANVCGLTTPLIKTASGEKMGKTVQSGGGIWLLPELTSPFDYYQSWMQCPDDQIESFLKLYTFLKIDVIEGLVKDSGLKVAKKVLAYEMTSLVHGHSVAMSAKKASEDLFEKKGGVPSLGDVNSLSLEVKDLKDGLFLTDVLLDLNMATSKSEGRRLIEQGGVYLNREPVGREDIKCKIGIDDVVESRILIGVGKKKFAQIHVV